MNGGKPVVNEVDRWGLKVDRGNVGVRHTGQAQLIPNVARQMLEIMSNNILQI